MKFGRYNPFPFRFGGGKRAVETGHEALSEFWEPAFDVSDDTAKACDLFAQAQTIETIWVASNRLKNQGQPLKMIDNLPIWEEVARLRPTTEDKDNERRRRLAGKLRGLTSNAVGDIHDAVEALLGANFISLVQVDPADEITYWPGQNPGPPGLEWSSNRAHLAVRMSKAGLTNDDFIRVRAEVFKLLSDLVPATMTFAIGVGDGFVVGEGIVGETFL